MGRKVKWTKEELDKLAKEFHDGAPVANMAARRSMSRIRMYQLLQKAGVTIGPRNDKVGPVTQDSIDRLDSRETI